MKRTMLAVLLLSIPMYLRADSTHTDGHGADDVILGGGSVGPQGPQGKQGNDGLNGSNGLNGKDGATGEKGATGDRGADAKIDDSAKLVVDAAIRLVDTKHFQLQVFDTYALDRRESHDVLGGGRNMMFGARVVFKLGKSYEERLIEKLQAELRAR